MPSLPPRVCNRCRKATPAGARCPCLPPPWTTAPGSAWSGGSTRRWTRFRGWWLTEHPLCNACGIPGRDVDHVIPLALFDEGPAREAARFDVDNVQTLCGPCHRAKTARDAAMGRNPAPPDATTTDALF